MKTVAIIQARMGSTRLPGKVMQELLPGRSLLALMLERVQGAKELDEIVVVVPETIENEPLAKHVVECGVAVSRGPEEDVLTRYLMAANEFDADMVVRVTSDCPLIDPAVIDLHIVEMRSDWHSADMTTNMVQQTFPLGLAVEALPFDVLRRMDRMSNTPYLREHVTTLAYDQPHLFCVTNVLDNVDRHTMRWTVDYPQDLDFARAVFQALYSAKHIFTKEDILELIEREPQIAMLNQNLAHG